MTFQLPDNMPSLTLSVPSESESTSSVELNGNLLGHWIKELPDNNIKLYIQLYSDALRRFNRNRIPEQERLILLDLYRAPLNNLLFRLSPTSLAKHIPDPTKLDKAITDLAHLMAELAMGYKIIIVDSNKKNTHLKMQPMALLAINRACEQLSYMALHAYKFYRTVPSRVFHELHQLYQLTFTADVENHIPFISPQLNAQHSFKERYSQLLLVSISNPYGLDNGEVLNAYQLMEQLASATEISPLPLGSKATAGHFYINCLSDRVPMPSVLPTLENQTQPPALVLNTKPVLVLVDSLFQQAKNAQDTAQQAEIRLLKLLIPYLNTSYERKQARLPVIGNKQVYLVAGVKAVHQCLSELKSVPDDAHPYLDPPWEVLNKNRSGYLVNRQNIAGQAHVMVGDFISVFEPNPKGNKPLAKVGFIRWMKTDHNNKTKIGLSLIEGDAIPVHFNDDETKEQQQALLLPEINHLKQAATLITDIGIFIPQRILHIRPKKKRFEFRMAICKLIASGNNFEQFTLEDIPEN